MTTIQDRMNAAVSQETGSGAMLPDLCFDPVGEAFEIDFDPSNQIVRIAYVVADPWPPSSFWGEHGEKGGFRRFKLASTRERYLRRLEAEGGYAFDVEMSKGAAPRARVVGRSKEVSGVYSLPAEAAAAVRKGEMTVPKALALADETLRDYSAWVKGDACGIVVEQFAAGTDGLSALDHDARWIVADEAKAVAMLGEVLGSRAIPVFGL